MDIKRLHQQDLSFISHEKHPVINVKDKIQQLVRKIVGMKVILL